MIEEIKQLTDEELAEIAEVSYLHNFENAKLLLGHIGYLLGEVERLQRERNNALSLRDVAVKYFNSAKDENKELQKIIETAVMFLQSNELHVKAEQIKAMVKKGLNHEIH